MVREVFKGLYNVFGQCSKWNVCVCVAEQNYTHCLYQMITYEAHV